MSEVCLSIPDQLDRGVATITIDRPHARNAISLATMDTLETVLDEVAATPVRVVVLRGAGDRAFVSGGDLKDLASLQTTASAAAMSRRMRHLLDRLAQLPALTIAALNGHALGGGAEVAIACDLRIVADDVTMTFNQSQLGILPAWGGIERLTALVGRSRALELMLTPRRMTAADAVQYGLVNEVVPREQFDARVEELATSVARLPSGVVWPVKALVDQVRPPVCLPTEQEAVDAFAAAWVEDAHWDAVETATRGRAAR